MEKPIVQDWNEKTVITVKKIFRVYFYQWEEIVQNIFSQFDGLEIGKSFLHDC